MTCTHTHKHRKYSLYLSHKIVHMLHSTPVLAHQGGGPFNTTHYTTLKTRCVECQAVHIQSTKSPKKDGGAPVSTCHTAELKGQALYQEALTRNSHTCALAASPQRMLRRLRFFNHSPTAYGRETQQSFL